MNAERKRRMHYFEARVFKGFVNWVALQWQQSNTSPEHVGALLKDALSNLGRNSPFADPEAVARILVELAVRYLGGKELTNHRISAVLGGALSHVHVGKLTRQIFLASGCRHPQRDFREAERVGVATYVTKQEVIGGVARPLSRRCFTIDDPKQVPSRAELEALCRNESPANTCGQCVERLVWRYGAIRADSNRVLQALVADEFGVTFQTRQLKEAVRDLVGAGKVSVVVPGPDAPFVTTGHQARILTWKSTRPAWSPAFRPYPPNFDLWNSAAERAWAFIHSITWGEASVAAARAHPASITLAAAMTELMLVALPSPYNGAADGLAVLSGVPVNRIKEALDLMEHTGLVSVGGSGSLKELTLEFPSGSVFFTSKFRYVPLRADDRSLAELRVNIDEYLQALFQDVVALVSREHRIRNAALLAPKAA